MPDVCAIIPTLGADAARTRRAVDAVLASRTTLAVEVIVVVNGEHRPELDALRAPTTRVIVVGANLGWPGGLHVGRAATTAPLLWLVQDDMVPDPDCLDALVGALRDPDGPALVGPVVVDEPARSSTGVIIDGVVQRHSLGGRLDPQIFRPDGAALDDVGSIIIDRFPPEAVPLAALPPIPAGDYIPSRGMLMAATTWDEVGGVDARLYPLGASDVDFCQALRARGHRFTIVPAARTTHERNASTPRALARAITPHNRRRIVAKWRDGDAGVSGLAAEVPAAVRDAVLIGATQAVAVLSDELQRVTAQRDTARARLATVIAENSSPESEAL